MIIEEKKAEEHKDEQLDTEVVEDKDTQKHTDALENDQIKPATDEQLHARTEKILNLKNQIADNCARMQDFLSRHINIEAQISATSQEDKDSLKSLERQKDSLYENLAQTGRILKEQLEEYLPGSLDGA